MVDPLAPAPGDIFVKPEQDEAVEADTATAEVTDPTPSRRKHRQSTPTQEVEETSDFRDNLPEWLRVSEPKEIGLGKLWWTVYSRASLHKVHAIRPPREFKPSAFHIDLIEEHICYYRHASKTVVFIGTGKGGATKTTDATWLAAILRQCHGMYVWVCDIDPNGGKALKRSGLDETMTISTNQLAKMVTQHQPATWLTAEWFLDNTVTDSASKVFITASEKVPVGKAEGAHNAISAEAMEATLDAARPPIHTIVVDSGPGLGIDANYGAVKNSQVRILVGDARSGDDLDDIQAALDWGDWDLRNKLDSVIIAISALPARDCNTRTQYEYAARYNVPPENIVLIPYNRYLEKTSNVNIHRLDVRTKYAFFTLAKRVTEMAVNANTPVPVKAKSMHELVIDLRQRRSSQIAQTKEAKVAA